MALRPEYGPQARFYVAVTRGMTARIGADWAYPGLVAKNPLHTDWRVTAYDARYSLRTLADCVRGELGCRPIRSHGVGRNCDLFNWTRAQAYRTVRTYERSGEFKIYLLGHAAELNRDAAQRGLFRGANGEPQALPGSEVKSVARSVAKWTWERRERFARFSEGKRAVRRGLLGFEPLSNVTDATAHLEAIKARQAASGVATATARAQATQEKVVAAVEELRAAGEAPTARTIAERTNMSQETALKHLRSLHGGQS